MRQIILTVLCLVPFTSFAKSVSNETKTLACQMVKDIVPTEKDYGISIEDCVRKCDIHLESGSGSLERYILQG
mgnify:CR=1 FL=1